jgi:hypothetical protein
LIGKGLVKNVVEAKYKKGQIFRVGIEFTDIIEDDVSSLLNEINRRMREVKKMSSSHDDFDCGAF